MRLALALAVIAVAALPAASAHAAPFDDVYADYKADGVIGRPSPTGICVYSLAQLQQARAGTPPDVAAYSPDFVAALDDAIRRRGGISCDPGQLPGFGGTGNRTAAAATFAAMVRPRLTSTLQALQSSLRKLSARSLAKRKSFLLTFQAPAAGELEALLRVAPVAGSSKTTTLARGSRIVTRAGKVRLRVRTTKAGRSALRKARHKMRLTMRATFTPDSDADNHVTVSRSLTLKRR